MGKKGRGDHVKRANRTENSVKEQEEEKEEEEEEEEEETTQ